MKSKLTLDQSQGTQLTQVAAASTICLGGTNREKFVTRVWTHDSVGLDHVDFGSFSFFFYNGGMVNPDRENRVSAMEVDELVRVSRKLLKRRLNWIRAS